MKRPLGLLIPDSSISKMILRQNIKGGKAILVSVGDRTTERLIEHGLIPDLQIVDGIERRVPRKKPYFEGNSRRVLTVLNPAGTITGESVNAILKSLNLLRRVPESPVRIDVLGEEDLLVLPVLACFPEGTTIAYGQPSKGMVIVAPSDRTRSFAKKVLFELGLGEALIQKQQNKV